MGMDGLTEVEGWSRSYDGCGQNWTGGSSVSEEWRAGAKIPTP